MKALLTTGLMLGLVGCSGPVAPRPTPLEVVESHLPPTPSTTSLTPQTQSQGSAAASGSGPGSVSPGPGDHPAAVEFPEHVEDLPGFREARNSVRPPQTSVTRLHDLASVYQRACSPCHGQDGAGAKTHGYANEVLVRDLRHPLDYRYGSSDRALFRTIKYGIPGTPMGSLETVMSDTLIWELVDYVKSLQVH